MTRRVVPFAALVLFTPLSAAPVPKGKPADLFPAAVGTKWEYARNGDAKRVYVEEVTESAEKDGVTSVTVSVTTDAGEARFEKFQIKDGEVRLTETNFGSFDPPLVNRKAGMKDGDSWVNKYTQNGAESEVTYTVGKAEEVTVPAGKFTAVPVTRKYAQQGGATHVYWYADGVGLVKQTTNDKPVQELKAFTAGKGAKK